MFQRFCGPQCKPEHVYTDLSKEFKKALKDRGWTHDCSTPYRAQTNRVAERAVRRVKEGTSCAREQSGFSEEWWPSAMMMCCFNRCVVDIMTGWGSPYFLCFKEEFRGPIIPFGAECEYQPASPKDKERLQNLVAKDCEASSQAINSLLVVAGQTNCIL